MARCVAREKSRAVSRCGERIRARVAVARVSSIVVVARRGDEFMIVWFLGLPIARVRASVDARRDAGTSRWRANRDAGTLRRALARTYAVIHRLRHVERVVECGGWGGWVGGRVWDALYG